MTNVFTICRPTNTVQYIHYYIGMINVIFQYTEWIESMVHIVQTQAYNDEVAYTLIKLHY